MVLQYQSQEKKGTNTLYVIKAFSVVHRCLFSCLNLLKKRPDPEPENLSEKCEELPFLRAEKRRSEVKIRARFSQGVWYRTLYRTFIAENCLFLHLLKSERL